MPQHPRRLRLRQLATVVVVAAAVGLRHQFRQGSSQQLLSYRLWHRGRRRRRRQQVRRQERQRVHQERQRVPVRVSIDADSLPEGTVLAAGMTATLTLNPS